MKAVFAILAAAAFTAMLCSCGTAPPVALPDFVGLAENACLPEAIIMAESLRKDGVRAKILIVNTPGFSHAVVAFLYPNDKPVLWVWDADSKLTQVKGDFDNADSVAHAWFQATVRDDTSLKASFL